MKTAKQNSTYMTLGHWYSFNTKIIGESIVVGVIVGFIIVIFRYLLEKTSEMSLAIYEKSVKI